MTWGEVCDQQMTKSNKKFFAYVIDFFDDWDLP